MAISVTKADVRPLPQAVTRRYAAASAVDAGDPVRLNTAGRVAVATGNSSVGSRAIGIAVADSNGDTASYATGDVLDVVVFGPVAGYASVDESKPIYVGGSSYDFVQTALGTGDVAGSTAYNYIVGRGDSSAGIIFVMPQMSAPTTVS